MELEDIVYVEYNGANRPHQVFTRNLRGYDFFMKNGFIQCEWSSGNIRPFLNKLCPEWEKKKKLKVWFNEDFRPTTNFFENNHILPDIDIEKMGYVKINKPLHLVDIVTAINDC